MPADDSHISYIHQPRDPSIYCEIYFPHKAAYQGTIHQALLDGKDPDHVKAKLRRAVRDGMVEELGTYANLLDPDFYSGQREKIKGSPQVRAYKRIDQYRSSFAGWSMYTVAGVFFGEDRKIPKRGRRPTQRLEAEEELVQVLRLIFRFSKRDLDAKGDKLLAAAQRVDCGEVYRIIAFRILSRLDRVQGLNPWDEGESDRFLADYAHWNTPQLEHKYEFARKYFSAIAREVEYWIDDCSLFVFCYLVRQFGQEVLQQRAEKQEVEIWVTHFLDLSVNVTVREKVRR
jgi:hypothetical protein